MKAVIFHEPGSSANLQMVDQPIPEPGPKDVRLRITSVGLNRADCVFLEGRYFNKPSYPSRIGMEGAGIVDAVGSEVTSYTPDDRVGVIPNMFDISKQGALAEYAIYPEDSIVATPESIPDEIAGSIWMQYITAWGALVTDANIKKGDPVVISAASSSVGIAAIQIVKMRKAISIATTTNPHKAETLRQLGADHVLDARSEDYVAQVKKLTHNLGARVTFDPVAGPAIRNHIGASARYGIIYIYGLLDQHPMDIHAGVLMKKLLTIKGYTFHSVLREPEVKASVLNGITEGINQGHLKPVIAKTFDFLRYREAFDYMESNQQIGKIVIAVN
ncbi:zinc-dependent alcohol dehydrogenase family protein [Deltaproteobacteria bacterium TL4]